MNYLNKNFNKASEIFWTEIKLNLLNYIKQKDEKLKYYSLLKVIQQKLTQKLFK